jgi:hypothetical protein
MDLIKLKDIKFGLDSYKKGFNSDLYYEWDVLQKSIEINGWSPNTFGYVLISEDNYCIDGHHRVVLLREMFGGNFKIEVIRLKGKYKWVFLKNVLKDLINLRFKRKKWYNI